MNTIFVLPTRFTPRIIFNSNGSLLIEGRSIPEDVYELYNPLVEVAKNLKQPKVELHINLEYFNSATSKKILDLLRCFDSNKKIDEFIVNWHYEADDEDSLEMAEIYAECLPRTHMNYKEHPELVTLYREYEPV